MTEMMITRYRMTPDYAVTDQDGQWVYFSDYKFHVKALRDRAAQQAKLAKERFEELQALREENERLKSGDTNFDRWTEEHIKELREKNQSLQVKVERLKSNIQQASYACIVKWKTSSIAREIGLILVQTPKEDETDDPEDQLA